MICTLPSCQFTSSLFCSRCKSPYCSAECQREDWVAHKKTCLSLRKTLQKEWPDWFNGKAIIEVRKMFKDIQIVKADWTLSEERVFPHLFRQGGKAVTNDTDISARLNGKNSLYRNDAQYCKFMLMRTEDVHITIGINMHLIAWHGLKARHIGNGNVQDIPWNDEFDKLILKDGMLVPDNRQVEQENERAVEMAAAYSAGQAAARQTETVLKD